MTPAPISRPGTLLLTLAVLSTTACSAPSQSRAEEAFAEEIQGQADPLPFHLSRPAPTPREEEELLARLESAIETWQGGDATGGADLADSVLALLPALADWRPLLRAAFLVGTPDTAGVRRALDEIDSALDFRSRWGWRMLVDAHEGQGDLEGARAAAVEATLSERNPATEASQWLLAGELALAAGDTARAREDLWTAVRRGNRYAGAREAAVRLDRIARALTEDEEVILGRALLAAGAWDRALERLDPQLAGGRLSPPDADEIRATLGRGLVELQRYGQAEQLLAPLLRADAPSDATLSALFWTGRASLGRGSNSEAAEAFRRLGELAPGSPLVAEGLLLLLQREMGTGVGPRARGALDDLLSAGVATTPAENTVTQLGADSYLAGDLSSAVSVFERYLEGSRRGTGRQQAAYWSALTRDRMGESAVAQTLWAETHAADPFSYYGLLAGERISAPLLPANLPGGPSPVPGLDPEIRNALLRLRVLRLAPVTGALAREVERLTDHFRTRRDGGYDFAEALIEGGFPLEGVSLGRAIQRDEGGWNLRLLRIVHPFPYRETIVREARARGIDPFFVAGLIRQESLFHAEIMSSAGAVGLMQLMPPTAREVAGTLGIPYSPDLLTDPETNIRMGTSYLASMTSRFGARAEDVLSAYNAGPTRARQWQQSAAHGDRDVFVEQIPFQETRNYVKLVQGYARMYVALYGCGDFEPCLGVSYRDALTLSQPSSGTTGAAPAR